MNEINKLNYLFLNFKEEQTIANQLQNTPEEVKLLDISLKSKVLKIKVSVFNLDFSLKEIL